ncbi:unnamed protein product, partial [Prorocentrum cordatum]
APGRRPQRAPPWRPRRRARRPPAASTATRGARGAPTRRCGADDPGPGLRLHVRLQDGPVPRRLVARRAEDVLLRERGPRLRRGRGGAPGPAGRGPGWGRASAGRAREQRRHHAGRRVPGGAPRAAPRAAGAGGAARGRGRRRRRGGGDPEPAPGLLRGGLRRLAGELERRQEGLLLQERGRQGLPAGRRRRRERHLGGALDGHDHPRARGTRHDGGAELQREHQRSPRAERHGGRAHGGRGPRGGRAHGRRGHLRHELHAGRHGLPVQDRVLWAADHAFEGDADACDSAHRLVVAQCPMCAGCTPLQSGCLGDGEGVDAAPADDEAEPPPPMASDGSSVEDVAPECSVNCTFKGASSSCGDRLHWVARFLFTGDPSSCQAAYGVLLKECQDCSGCSAELAGCTDNASAATGGGAHGNRSKGGKAQHEKASDDSSKGGGAKGDEARAVNDSSKGGGAKGGEAPHDKASAEKVKSGAAKGGEANASTDRSKGGAAKGGEAQDGKPSSDTSKGGGAKGGDAKVANGSSKGGGAKGGDVKADKASNDSSKGGGAKGGKAQSDEAAVQPGLVGFDCNEGLKKWERGWSDDKKKWCCSHHNKGCVTTVTTTTLTTSTTDDGFDCSSGYYNWKRGWSDEKKTWCCEQEKRACPDGDGAKRGAGHAHRDGHQRPHQSTASTSSAAHSRSSTSSTATSTTSQAPYNCDEDYVHRRTRWAPDKKRWCCDFEAVGCSSEDTTTELDPEPSSSGADADAANASGSDGARANGSSVSGGSGAAEEDAETTTTEGGRDESSAAATTEVDEPSTPSATRPRPARPPPPRPRLRPCGPRRGTARTARRTPRGTGR